MNARKNFLLVLWSDQNKNLYFQKKLKKKNFNNLIHYNTKLLMGGTNLHKLLKNIVAETDVWWSGNIFS